MDAGVNVIGTVDITLCDEGDALPLNSDRTLFRAVSGWEASTFLKDGLRNTFSWIKSQSEALACA